MVSAEDIPGGLKARQVLKQMELNPPRKRGGRDNAVIQWIEGIYPELRAVREKGWSWKAIHAELSKLNEFPRVCPSYLSRIFYEMDAEWAKKTGTHALAKRKNGKRGARPEMGRKAA